MNFHIFKDLKIWQKILLVFQFMMLPALIIFFMLMVSTNKLNSYQNSMLLENLSSITAASNLENSLMRLRGLKSYYLLDGNYEWITDFNRNVESFNYWYDACFRTAYSEEERDILSAMSVDFIKYMSIHEKILKAVRSGDRESAKRMLLKDSNESFDDIFNGCEKLINKNMSIINETAKKLHKYTSRGRILAYITLGCFFVFGSILITLVTRSIVGPINEIEKASRGFTDEKNDRNEIEMLKERFGRMIETINENQKKLIVSERRAAIGEIAAGISHELNNPVGIIYGFAEVLVNREQITEDDREYIEDIFRETQRCKKLLKDLLDFARTPEPSHIETDVYNLINETVGLLKNQNKYKNITFSVTSTGDTIIAYIDPFQIKQVLLNLLINSCNAMNYDGTVGIKVNNNMNSLTITVTDQGEGIKPENIEKIFKPFFSTKSDGIGLGLAVCRDIISKHNGTLEASSEYGKGAEFVINIPAGNNENIQ